MIYHYWFTVNYDKIDRIKQTADNEVPVSENGEVWLKGDDTIRQEENFDWLVLVGDVYHRPSDDELVALGKRHDNRGRWYDKSTGQYQDITGYDIDPPPNSTLKEPPAEPYQKWDEDNDGWVVDTEKKERAEKEKHLWELKEQLAEIDREAGATKSVRAIQIATAEASGAVHECAECKNMEHHCPCCSEYKKLVKAEAEAAPIIAEIARIEEELAA